MVVPLIKPLLGKLINKVVSFAQDLALFSLLNKTTLVPEVGTHSSFTSGAGVIENSDGNLQALPTNCIKFEGARYVENLVTNSHVPATQTIISAKAGEYVFQCKNGGNVSISGATDGSYGSITAGATEIKQLTFTVTVSQNITITVTTAPDAFQLEDKTSYVAASQIIGSEIVSTGVESSPYHGCNVDGIKAYSTALGNTVSSGVITIGTGAALTSLLGQLYEPAATNLFLNSFVPVTQNITTTAQDYTVSIEGAGDITLTGTATGVATDGNPLTVTATAGTLTCTKNGVVTKVNVEATGYSTSFIETAGSSVTRNGTLDKKVAPADYTDNMTISMTLNTKDFTVNNGYLVSFTDGGVNALVMLLSSGKIPRILYGSGSGTISVISSTSLVENTEYKLMFWLNEDDGVAIFVDGIEKAANVTAPVIDKTETIINIGSAKSSAALCLGVISDVIIKKQKITKAAALTQAAAL